MDIVLMNGGLGNQVFQYIFARYVEETKKERVLIDDLSFYLNEDIIKETTTKKPPNSPDKLAHNGYELDYVFPYMEKPLLLSEYFEPDVWRYMVEESRKTKPEAMGIVQQLLANGVDLSVLFEAVHPNTLKGLDCPLFQTLPNRYNSAVVQCLNSTVYYYGYWINPGWFNRYKDILLKDLAFRPIQDAQNLQYQKAIQESFAIGVHIRRGDFIKVGWQLPESYYYNVFSVLTSRHPEATYFIFSDDQEWCKANSEPLGIPENTIFVEGNYDYKNNYIDVQLMAMCNVLVVGASSFSYLASLLNQTPGFYAIQVRNPPVKDLAGGIQRIYV